MGARERLEVLGQTTAAPQPTERAFDNPTLLEHHKALCGVRALHDFQSGPRGSAHRPGCFFALVSPVRDHPLQKRKRSEEHTSELQSRQYLVCRLLLEKKKT